MPAPDPDGMYLDEDIDGFERLMASVDPNGNYRHRVARLQSIARNRQWGWLCEWCCEPVPLYKRADARFCRERCRQAAKRARRG